MRRQVSWLLVFLAVTIAAVWWWRSQREHRYDKQIVMAAQEYHVPAALVKAVVWRESWFDPDVRGKAKEIGLMQIKPSVGQEWAKEEHAVFRDGDLFSPTINTRVGAWYLHKLLKRYLSTDNAVPYALADYNAGRKNVLRWNQGLAVTNSESFTEQIGFPSTQKYVRTVMERYEGYREEFPVKK